MTAKSSFIEDIFSDSTKPLSKGNDSNFSRKPKALKIDAEYTGGERGWMHFLSKYINPNIPIKNGAPIGEYKVYVQFTIDQEGNVTRVIPLTSFGYGMEEELIRVIEKSGKWKPATKDGLPVKAYRKQAITFYVDPK